MNPTQPHPSPLLNDFAPAAEAQWRELVAAELKGAPFEKKMVSPTWENIPLQPIYTSANVKDLSHLDASPGFSPFHRGADPIQNPRQPWIISQEITSPSPAEFNRAARLQLSQGLNALHIVLDQAACNGLAPDASPPSGAASTGLSIATLDDLDQALDGIDLNSTPLFADAGNSALPFAALLIALTQQRRIPLSELRGCIEMDPLGVLSHSGKLPQSLDDAHHEMAILTRWAASHAPHLQTVCVQSRPWHEAGANAVQEIAFALAAGIHYLREFHRRGIDVETASPRLRFAVTAGSHFFMEIAKLRALRLVWSAAIAAMHGSENARRPRLHVQTAHWNKTACDPRNNILRAAIEAFAGAVGGCASMSVGPFDEVFRAPDDFSQRIARNTQLILQSECQLEYVTDPAGGSWFVERLTADLAHRAWDLFQEIERQGGMASALRSGFPQETVARTAREKAKAIASRRESIVGVNRYANPKEPPIHPGPQAQPPTPTSFPRTRVEQAAPANAARETALEKLSALARSEGSVYFEAAVAAAAAGATLGEITRAIRPQASSAPSIAPFQITRAAVPFEQLRAAIDRFAAQGNPRPAVFLCQMGPVHEHKPRADFARGFFETGGYEVLDKSTFASPEDAAFAFSQTHAVIAVLCSTDELYPALVPAWLTALRLHRPHAIAVLAGCPPDQFEAHQRAGIDEFIHLKASAVELLRNFHRRAGMPL